MKRGEKKVVDPVQGFRRYCGVEHLDDSVWGNGRVTERAPGGQLQEVDDASKQVSKIYRDYW